MDRKKATDEARREPWWIVTLAVWNIDESTDEEQSILLDDLSCAAWPTPIAQAQ